MTSQLCGLDSTKWILNEISYWLMVGKRLVSISFIERSEIHLRLNREMKLLSWSICIKYWLNERGWGTYLGSTLIIFSQWESKITTAKNGKNAHIKSQWFFLANEQKRKSCILQKKVVYKILRVLTWWLMPKFAKWITNINPSSYKHKINQILLH